MLVALHRNVILLFTKLLTSNWPPRKPLRSTSLSYIDPLLTITNKWSGVLLLVVPTLSNASEQEEKQQYCASVVLPSAFDVRTLTLVTTTLSIVLTYVWLCLVVFIVPHSTVRELTCCFHSWRSGYKKPQMNPKTWSGWWQTRRSVRSVALLLRRTEDACTWHAALPAVRSSSVGCVEDLGRNTVLQRVATINATSTTPPTQRKKMTKPTISKPNSKHTCSTSIATSHTKTQGYVSVFYYFRVWSSQVCCWCYWLTLL
jgi:hypothetical protein